MERGGTRRVVWLVAGLLVLCAAVAGLARWRLDVGHPPAAADWWKPRHLEPTLDPELLARAAQERRVLAGELAERRSRLRPVPERLREATAVAQLGHAGPLTALAWYGSDVLTAGRDATLRSWRFDGRRLREFRPHTLPGVATAVVAAPGKHRVWAFLAPDRLVVREGLNLEVERTRLVPPGRALGLAVADDGQRIVLLLERSGAGGRAALAVRHYLEPGTVLLKEVAFEVAGPSAASLAPDGERLAVLVRGVDGPEVELRRAADGAVLRSVAPAVPWWSVEAPGPRGAVTLGLGVDLLAVVDEGGTLVVPFGGDGEPGEPLPFPHPAGGAPGFALRAVCDGAVVVDGPSGASVLRRTASGWRTEPAGPSAALASCTAGGTVVALGRGARLEARSPAGSDTTTSAAELSAALLVSGGARIDLLRAAGPEAFARASFELTDFTASTAETRGELLAVDPAFGELLWSVEGELRLETSGGTSAFEPFEGIYPRVLRAGVAAGFRTAAVPGGVVEDRVPREARVVLQDRGGVLLGWWLPPGWLGVPRLSLCSDGRTVVAAGRGGFVVWRAGVEEPVLYFPGEGYEGAPGETSPDGRFVLLGRNDGTVEHWSLESWEVERSAFAINEQGGRPTVLRWSVDGEALFVGGARGGVVALQGRTGNPLWGDVLHDGPVTVLEPAASGAWVLSADARTAVLTAAKGGERLLRVALGDDGSWAAFTVDGYHVAGGPAGAGLLALRQQAVGTAPGEREWTVIGAEDPDFAALGGAVDALRVTLLGAASSGEEE